MSQDSRTFLKLINRDSGRVSIDEDRIRQAREIQKERHMSNKEKNPKQVLIDWVINVESSAEEAREHVQKYVKGDSSSGHLNSARENLSCILGQCEAMMTVLKNSD